MQGQLEIVVPGAGDLKNARQPEVDIKGQVRELRSQLLAKQADLIGSERLIPEQQPVGLNIFDLLRKSRLEDVKDFVEIR